MSHPPPFTASSIPTNAGRVNMGERISEVRMGRSSEARSSTGPRLLVDSSGATPGRGTITGTSAGTGISSEARSSTGPTLLVGSSGATPGRGTITGTSAGTEISSEARSSTGPTLLVGSSGATSGRGTITGTSAGTGTAYAARGTTSDRGTAATGSGTVVRSGNSTGSSPHPLNGLLTTILTTVNGNTVTLAAILEEQKRLSDSITELQQKSFSIEGSVYKEGLLKEIGISFGNTLNRRPSQTMVKAMVNRVLKREAEKKYKFAAAITFCNSRFNELRAEERRRVFGLHPCERFAAMGVDEFVDKFLPVLKVEQHSIPHYTRHVVLLRKFCRTVLDSHKNTYKVFSQWLNGNFANGMPTAEKWDSIVEENQPVDLRPANSPLYMDHDDPDPTEY